MSLWISGLLLCIGSAAVLIFGQSIWQPDMLEQQVSTRTNYAHEHDYGLYKYVVVYDTYVVKTETLSMFRS